MTVYATYLTQPERHANAAGSHPGFGDSPEAALTNSLYWHNQEPWTRTVPLSRAPRWVQEAYAESQILEDKVGCCICGALAPAPMPRREAEYWRCEHHA